MFNFKLRLHHVILTFCWHKIIFSKIHIWPNPHIKYERNLLTPVHLHQYKVTKTFRYTWRFLWYLICLCLCACIWTLVLDFWDGKANLAVSLHHESLFQVYIDRYHGSFKCRSKQFERIHQKMFKYYYNNSHTLGSSVTLDALRTSTTTLFLSSHNSSLSWLFCSSTSLARASFYNNSHNNPTNLNSQISAVYSVSIKT